MSDRIETGPGQVESDRTDLDSVMQHEGGIYAGAIRTILRRIESLGDSLRGRIARGEDRIDAVEKAEANAAGKAETTKAIRDLDRSLVARLDANDARLDMLDRRTARVQQYDERGYPIPPAPSSPEIEERGGRVADDFLTPPPIARAIGRAVLRAAEGIPYVSEAEPAASADVLGLAVQGMIRAVETGIRIGSACETLRSAAERAKRAGVIP